MFDADQVKLAAEKDHMNGEWQRLGRAEVLDQDARDNFQRR
jgi:hypothetical protein